MAELRGAALVNTSYCVHTPYAQTASFVKASRKPLNRAILRNAHPQNIPTAMFEKLKQYKDLRDKAKTIQNTLKDVSVRGSADGGRVQVMMDGNQHVLGIDIDPDHLRTEKREALQKHLADAVNDAIKKSQH